MKRERTIIFTVLALASFACLLVLNPTLRIILAQTGATQQDATQQYETIRAIINPRLTLTSQRFLAQTETSQAINAVTNSFKQSQTALFQTQTPTPSSTDPGYTNTPPNATDIFRTAIAGANQQLTQTYSLHITQAFQLTVNSIINQTLGISPTATATNTFTPSATPSMTSTAPTPTPNVTQTYQTMIAVINHSLTETPEAQIAQSVTAVYQSTVQSFQNQQASATAAIVEGALATGYDQITADNATKLTGVLTLQNHDAMTNALAFSSDGTQFASANSDHTVRLWDTLSGSELYTFPGLTDRLSVSFSANGAYLASASSDNTIRLWDLKSRQELTPLRGHMKGVVSAVFNPTGPMLVSIGSDRTTRIWNPPSTLSTTTIKQSGQALAFSPDGLQFITGGTDARITIWESLTGLQLSVIRDSQALTAFAYSQDNKFIVSGGLAYFVTTWDIGTQKKVQSFKGPTKPITSVAFCSDGSCVVAASKDGSIWLWNAQTGEKILTLAGAKNGVNSLAISSDGRRLITAGADSTITVWAIPTGS